MRVFQAVAEAATAAREAAAAVAAKLSPPKLTEEQREERRRHEERLEEIAERGAYLRAERERAWARLTGRQPKWLDRRDRFLKRSRAPRGTVPEDPGEPLW